MKSLDSLRSTVVRLLDARNAHVTFDAAFDGLPSRLRGKRPARLQHSPWELLEHIRLAQQDILEFCIDPDFVERPWPAGYWPATPAPPSAAAWQKSLSAYRADRRALVRLARDRKRDLFGPAVPGSSGGVSLLDELLLVADHTAYHLGQVVLVRRALGAWK